MHNCVAGQSYDFRHYQAENGLSNNAVLCSIQDRQGFLWFGTKDGLNRFDGYTFKIYRNIKGDKESLGENYIQTLCEGDNGLLWIGTGAGLYSYDPVKERFALLKGCPEELISSIQMDETGNCWFIAGITLYRFSSSTGQLTRYAPERYFRASSICMTEEGELWVASLEGLLKKYDPGKDLFTSYPVLQPSASVQIKAIEKIYSTGQRSILVGTLNHGVKLFDTRSMRSRDILDCNPDKTTIYARDFARFAANEYWIATESGIFIYNILTGKSVHLTKQYNNPYSLTDNAVYTLCLDRQGGMWSGTYFGGVNYLPRRDISFEKFFPGIGPNGLSGNAVREICRDHSGNLWIGTEDAGLNVLKKGSNVFTHFMPTGKRGSITYSNIHGLLAAGDTLWIGTFENGLDLMNIHTGQVIRHYSTLSNPASLKSNFIYTIFQTREGDILIGTGAGLYCYNKKADDFTAVPQVPYYSFVASIYEDSNGYIWVGTFRDGVYFYHRGTGVSGNLRNNNPRSSASDSNSLGNNRVNGILEDNRHILWFATEGGLSRYDPSTGRLTTYTTKDGLPSNIIYRCLPDGKNNLWVSTSKGLICLSLTNGQVQTFTTVNGLLNDQFNYNSAFRDTDGRMYFGSVKGMISFRPDEYIPPSSAPPVYITGFQVYNKELPVNHSGSPLKNAVTYTARITLPYDQSTFSIDFAALNYTAPEMTKYQYRMEGLDKTWTYLQSNRKVYFTELPPGNYTFQVKASQTGYVWNETPATMVIRILPPFWLSPLAWIFYGIILVSGIFLCIRAYHLRVQAKTRRRWEILENEKEKEIYHAKIEFFTNIAHEIKTPLTLIKLPLDKTLLLAEHDPALMHNLTIMGKNTDRLIDLTNQLLDFRKTESNGLALNFVKSDISELLVDLYRQFKPAAEQRDLHVRIDLPKMPFQAYVDPEAFRKILSNLFSNAIKYARHQIQVGILPFNSEDDRFTIRIANDGTLIPGDLTEKIFEPFFRLKETSKQPGTGIGLALARSLAQLHHGTLTASASDALNNFLLTLPVHQDQQFEWYEESARQDKNSQAGAGDSHINGTTDEARHERHTEREEKKGTILLVEDNSEILDLVSAELSGDYRILKAFNGSEALHKLKDEVVHLVISDIMMPVMNGLELCQMIKSNFEYSHIPVILLTAKTSLQSKIEGLEQGADAYIEKPFSSQHLMAQITSLLTNRNKIKEYFATSPLVHIKTIAHSREDETFLLTLQDIISANLENFDFNVEQLAGIMNMSKPTLYRKIKALSNLTPNELINITRLKKGSELLLEGKYKIYEIADMLGYSLPANFSRDFTRQFNMSPSEYVSKKKNYPSAPVIGAGSNPSGK
ncbi:MAG: response regulator [Chitinophagaceae bacterium]|nr:response regulator [Chitinophagaceae bacterium]